MGVNKINGLYAVYNRCDGGYPTLRFKKNEFYFYSPQEGANYIIKEVKSNNDKYIINTSGYYFLKGESILKQNDTWYLEKQDNLLWSFRNKNWGKSTILTDSLNIIKKKIGYTIQPCRECSDECGDEVTNDNLLGRWSANCDNPIGITIKDNNQLIMTIEPNQYYIHLIKIEDKTEKNIIKYKLKQFEGLGSKEVYSEAYLNDKEVAVIKILDGNKIEFNWLGFYNKVNKQRQYTESLISNENPVILTKCE
ncbi:MAG: hypothetical protein K0R36_3465 [Chryseobacterium sp.]|nr:hypothetical protein [Chryseobacterium sp.]